MTEKLKKIFKSKWYKNCKRRRKEKAKIYQDCPFIEQIKSWEK